MRSSMTSLPPCPAVRAHDDGIELAARRPASGHAKNPRAPPRPRRDQPHAPAPAHAAGGTGHMVADADREADRSLVQLFQRAFMRASRPRAAGRNCCPSADRRTWRGVRSSRRRPRRCSSFLSLN
jgi:hypothetical protein